MPTLMPIKTEKAKMIRLLMPIDGIERKDDSLIVSGYCFVNEDIGSGKKIKRAAMEAATDDYMTWGAVREMHRPSAVGTAIGELEDGSKLGVEWRKEGAYFRCKIVDSEAIKKCEEGVYRAFSIGVNPTIVRGDWVLACSWAEISLVDRPGDKDCPFDALSRTEDAESEVSVLERMSFNEYVSCQETGQRIYAAFDWLLSSIYDIRSSESDEKSALVRQTCAEFAEYIGPLVDEEGESRSVLEVLARLGRLEAEENAEITRLSGELESREAAIALPQISTPIHAAQGRSHPPTVADTLDKPTYFAPSAHKNGRCRHTSGTARSTTGSAQSPTAAPCPARCFPA